MALLDGFGHCKTVVMAGEWQVVGVAILWLGTAKVCRRNSRVGVIFFQSTHSANLSQALRHAGLTQP